MRLKFAKKNDAIRLDYTVLDLEAGEEVDELTLRKQFIYEDDFVKDEGDGNRQEFSVTRKMIDHWVTQGNQMIAEGVAIPMPKGHTSDPEAKRAEVTRFAAGLDEKGRYSLFGYCKFKDKKSLEALRASNVSIEAIKEMVSGKDTKYTWPIIHVAFTDYPVIPDLGPFQAIAASLLAGPEDDPMEQNAELVSLCEEFGIEVTEDMDDAALGQAIRDYVAALSGEGVGDEGELVEEDLMVSHEGVSAGRRDATASPVVIDMVRDARSTEIDQLVAGRHITPAVAKELKKDYCSDKAVRLSMARQPDAPDPFKAMVRTLKLNRAIPTERTGAQGGFALAHGNIAGSGGNGNRAENPMVRRARLARERAEKRAKK